MERGERSCGCVVCVCVLVNKNVQFQKQILGASGVIIDVGCRSMESTFFQLAPGSHKNL